MQKIYFDGFNRINAEKAEADYKYCPKCKDRNLTAPIMLEIGHIKPTEPAGEMFFCKKCDNTILIIYDKSKERFILEMAENGRKHILT